MKYDLHHLNLNIAHLKRPTFGKNPQADWKTMLICSTVAAFFCVLFGLYLFVRVNGGTIFVKKIQEEVVTEAPRMSVLKQVMSQFETKRMRFEEMRETTLDIEDPSL